MALLLRLWRAKWAFARLAAAGVLLVLFLADRPAHLARVGLAALPDMDAAERVRDLRERGQFGDALLVADAAREWTTGDALAKLDEERRLTVEQQGSWLRKAKEVGLGALTGRGDSLERLVGAVGSDLFLVGDLRDLTLESLKQASGGDPDEIIVLLSTAGVVTSLAPEIDWAPAVVKAAKKMGALGERLEQFLRGALREGRWADARRVIDPAGELARASSPATALRVMPAAASADDLARLARFAESGKEGALALQVGGLTAAELVLAGERTGARAMKSAVRKGPRGFEYLAGAGRAAMRPHLILGLAKGLWKGNLTELAERAVERLAPQGWWLIPLLAAWTALEALGLWKRLAAPRPAA